MGCWSRGKHAGGFGGARVRLAAGKQAGMCGETILPIEHQLIGMPGARREDLRAVASHPMALAQCERFFSGSPKLKRVPAEDTAGSVLEMMERGPDKHFGAIAGRRAAGHYGAVILQENIQDNAENFTRFVLLLPPEQAKLYRGADAKKISLAMRLAHKPGALLASLEPVAKHGVNFTEDWKAGRFTDGRGSISFIWTWRPRSRRTWSLRW